MAEPMVSIIVPVLNAEEKIGTFLKALKKQDYPSERYEIIVVDNGSTDDTIKKAHNSAGITLLEKSDIQNPYAARNEGLRHAKGDILVLLDVNCTPTAHWLKAGVGRLVKGDAGLAGGRITFTFSNNETLGKWYDSLLFVDMEDLIKRGKSCAGGNLFFKREVLETIGYFPENQRSGSDLYWTKKATNNGFELVYEPDAEVTYPARKLKPLMQKVFRVGTGQPKIWLENGMHPLKMIALIFYQLVPPGTNELRSKIKRRGKEAMNDSFISLWIIHYLLKIILAAGWTRGLVGYYMNG